MKKIRPFILVFTATLVNSAFAQKTIVNAYGSYVMEGSYNADYGDRDFLHGKTCDGLQLGVGAERILSQNYGLEIMYLRRNTAVFQESELAPQQKINFNIALNYLLAGINGYLQPDTKNFQAYGSMFAGMVLEEIDFPDNGINSTITKFAWAVRLGGKYWLSNRVGVRLQAQWTSFLKMGNSFPATSVSGLNIANISFPIAYQFELGSGLMVKIGSNNKD